VELIPRKPLEISNGKVGAYVHVPFLKQQAQR